MNIFIAHASDKLTDHRPHGDGLVAYGFIKSLAARGHTLHVAVHKAEIREALPANVHLYPILTKHAKGPRQRLEYMIGIRRLLRQLRREHSIDLIHQLNPVFTGLSLALIGAGLPLALGPYVGSWPPESESKRRYTTPSLQLRLLSHGRAAFARLQQSFADLLLITTPDAISRIPAAARLGSRIRVLPHGIDAAAFPPRAGATGFDTNPSIAPLEAKPLTILFYAHVWHGKGLDTLLDAFDRVADAVPGVRLTVAGDGDDLPALKQRAALLTHADRVTFLGVWSRENAVDLFHQADVYCLPSRGEPFGMTALEAMSCATPLVATKAGGLGHLVQPGGGRLVSPSDPDSLAKALIELLSDPIERAAMARFNRTLVETVYAWERVAERLEALYEETLNRRRERKPQRGGSRSENNGSTPQDPRVQAVN